MAYKPLEDYGIIGDLSTLALVGTDGSIDFLCLPHFDSPSIFAALLDEKKGGRFAITAADENVRRRQLYLPDTNVLLTRFLSEDGIGEITDFMPVADMRHAHAVVRRVRAVRGPFRFRFACEPRFDYARGSHRAEAADGEVLFLPDGDGDALRLRSPVPLQVHDDAAFAELTLQTGEQLDFVLEVVRPDRDSPSGAPDWVERAFAHTVDYWRDWVSHSTYRGRWRDMVLRSALALKLLTSQTCGSIAAAGTFGLPELVGGERNWDYRYTWIRDASFTAAILVRLGFGDEARALVGWITDRYDETDEPGRLQIMYGIDGRHELSEQIIPDLEGYRGSAPVRVGNAAYDQLQLDIYGELLYFIDLYDQHVEPIPYDLWRHLSESIDWMSRNWSRPDEGIWEVRGGQQEFLYSRLTSWLALERGVRIARRRALPAPLSRWEDARDEIHNDIYFSFWNDERAAFIQHKGTTTLDASTLLMPLVDFISPRDRRWLSTLAGITEDLVDDALVYRYRTEEAASDGLTGTEGTFCMCSYWYAECLARSGAVQQARLLFEKMHGYANHLGLYAEEMDATGRYLGNFPQAFTHVGLVSSALYLDWALSRPET